MMIIYVNNDDNTNICLYEHRYVSICICSKISIWISIFMYMFIDKYMDMYIYVYFHRQVYAWIYLIIVCTLILIC
jgi:hypothetical protein